jgi:hypothetical protein
MGTETAEASDDRFVPIGDAAAATGVPRRTIYRWRTNGSVPSREAGGQLLVSLAAVKELAAARRKPTAAPVAGPVAIPGTFVDGYRADDPRSDGKLAAEMFRHFNSGKTPIEVVEMLAQPPRVVSAMHLEWVALQVPTEPNYDRRLLAIETDLAQLHDDVGVRMDLVRRVDAGVIDIDTMKGLVEHLRSRISKLDGGRP